MLPKKYVDFQLYMGYKLVLPTFDWDDEYRVYDSEDNELARKGTLSEAREWVRQQKEAKPCS